MKHVIYGLLVIFLLINQSLMSKAEDEESAITQQTIIGALSTDKGKKASPKNNNIDTSAVKKVITILEDKKKREDLIETLKTIVAAQEKIEKKNDQGMIASTRSLLGSFAERSLVGLQSMIVSSWKIIEQTTVSLVQCSFTDMMVTFGIFLGALMIALLVETFVGQFSRQQKQEDYQLKTLGGQLKFILSQTTKFIAFCIPLYVTNAIGIGILPHFKFFGLELASFAILVRAAIKIRGMHLYIKNREISEVLTIILVFMMMVFFVFLYLIQKSYLLHLGIYFFVLLGFFLSLRLSLWRGQKRDLEHWLFFKISHTSFGNQIYRFNDKLLKGFSVYFLLIMTVAFIQFISGYYDGQVHEDQLFATCFLLLLTILAILLAVYAKYGLLILTEHYSKPEMVKFYQSTLLSMMDIVVFLVVIFLSKSITELWFNNFINILFHPEYQYYLRSISKIILYAILSRFLWRFIDFVALMNMSKKKEGKKTILPSQLRLTVTPILKSVGHWLLLIFTCALILEELGVPIWPIIYSISVFGIAISLGAQSLVKDFINGILTLVEGNIAIGEVVTIGAFTGVVETLSLRGVVLRHSTGALQTIPFSEVTNIINRSRDYGMASIEVPVPFETKLSDVNQALKLAFEDIQGHEIFGSRILDKLNISGVDRMEEGAYYVSASIKIKPDPSGKFLKAFNEFLQARLLEFGIKPPLINAG